MFDTPRRLCFAMVLMMMVMMVNLVVERKWILPLDSTPLAPTSSARGWGS